MHMHGQLSLAYMTPLYLCAAGLCVLRSYDAGGCFILAEIRVLCNLQRCRREKEKLTITTTLSILCILCLTSPHLGSLALARWKNCTALPSSNAGRRPLTLDCILYREPS